MVRRTKRSGTDGLLRVTAVLVLAVGHLACQPEPEPVRRDVRLILETPASTVLDPIVVTDGATASIAGHFFEGLVAFDREVRIVPVLAATWQTVDERTWKFQLRPGVRFHDGSPLTAEVVRQALERARGDPGSRVKRHLVTVQDIETVGELTLQISTVDPDMLLLNRLVAVLISRPSGTEAGLVGTGPFRPLGWSQDGVLEARSFAGHWGGPPGMARVEISFGADQAAAVAKLRAGEVDLIRLRDPSVLRDAAGLEVVAQGSLGSVYLWPDAEPRTDNPLADARVRRAISLALDREALARRFVAQARPLHQLVPAAIFGHDPELGQVAFDPEGARELLREADYAGGIDLTLSYTPEGSVTQELVETVRRQLAEVDVRIALEALEWRELVAGWQEGTLPFFISGWLLETGDAMDFLRDCIATRDPALGTGAFNPGFSSPVLDELIAEHASIRLAKERRRHFSEIMARAREETPVIPLFTPQIFWARSEDLDWQPRLDGKLLAAEMSWR